jgi:cell division septal protein FtsQ
MRSLIFIAAIFLIFSSFFKKDYIFKFFKNTFDKKISEIHIENLKNLSPKLILDSIYLKKGDYFWSFNPEKLKKDFEKINEIESYDFTLKKNGILHIFIVEKTPYMIWIFSGKKKIIDDEGNVLRLSGFKTDELIEISGYLNKKKFAYLNNILNKKVQFKSLIKNIYYYENTGWQLILRDKTCLILPEKKIDKALSFFEKKIKNSKIYFDHRFYDMRILERIYLSKTKKCLPS